MNELIIDNFAGGGGASTGIALALGRGPDLAINHDAEALAMHAANHPGTRHLREDVFAVDIAAVVAGRPVGLGWFSPDCKHFSKAKGGKPREKRIRALAWVMVKWAAIARPRVLVLENVEEFQTWGPLAADGMPCPRRRGATFRRFVARLRALGYAVEWRELRACDYGAPTIRKRLFLIARCDGCPIVWPAPTHADPKSKTQDTKAHLPPWRTVAECIDWSLPCPSIFGRKRPLAVATLRRIARGLRKFVFQAAEPFVISVAHGEASPGGVKRWGDGAHACTAPLGTQPATNKFAVIVPSVIPLTHHGDERVHDVGTPLPTVTGAHRGELALIAPTLVQTGYGEHAKQKPRAPGLDKPLGTIMAGGAKHALVAAFLAKHYGGVTGTDLRAPVGTVTSTDHHSLVTAHVAKLRGANTGHAMGDPAHTISAQGTHLAEVRAFLVKYYGNEKGGHGLSDPAGTVTTRDRLGLVTIQGTDYVITDIGLRMLTPRELFRAQGFPGDYIIGDDGRAGLKLTKTAQVRMCGNSVCPPVACAIVAANVPELAAKEAAA